MTTQPTTTRRSIAELRRIATHGARLLADAPAEEVSAWAAETFPGTLAVACSMADAVVPHLISQHSPGVDVIFLDTGYHFAETLGARAQVELDLPVRVLDIRPALTVAEQDLAHGPRLYARDPAHCCRMRKVEPLRAALAGYEAWASGLRRAESPARAGTPLVTFDDRHGLVKINPLAAWSSDDVAGYAARHAVPVNLLVSEEYPSIGCAPCTRPVAPGEDPRSGRWAGSAKTECGIHG